MASGLNMYVELNIQSNFSFLQAASHPEEYVEHAKNLGYQAIGIADSNTFAGIIRAELAAREHKLKFYPACRLELYYDSKHFNKNFPRLAIIAYPINKLAYAKLCQLLTTGKRRTNRSECILSLNESLSYLKNCALIIEPPYQPNIKEQKLFKKACATLSESFSSDLLSLALSVFYQTPNRKHWEAVLACGKYFSIAPIATNTVKFHSPDRKALFDIITCIKHKTNLASAGFLLEKNPERYLKSPQEMQRLFKNLPIAITRTKELASRLEFSIDQLHYDYPDAVVPNHNSATTYLRQLTMQGAISRYPAGVPIKIKNLIEEELKLIEELRYEKYFLTCHEIVRFARSRNILCQGRGSAANSAVCYCLGITAVDPEQIDILFTRFVSKERAEPPDIDIDFEHERREEVIQYIYETYGRDYAALTAEVVTFQARSALREVGKACGLSQANVDALAKIIHRWTGFSVDEEDLIKIGLDPNSKQVKHTLEFSNELINFPRHLAQHVGGFIISNEPLTNIVPICNAAMENRSIIEWDKGDIEALGIFKIDILGLGMLTCIRKGLDLLNQARIKKQKLPLGFFQIPKEDPEVYDMLCNADTVGVFQVESRAQMSMLPRLRPRCFYDIVIEIAIVRPGPIQGNMVHPYLRRRNNLESVSFPDQRVANILGKTLGVPIFQEQAMRLAISLAEFSPEEAEALRRAMAAWKRNKNKIAHFKERIITGMKKKGYSEEYAEVCLKQIQGFSEYGFPESHSASFALLVYTSAWIKKHHPAEFAAALINSQPMGFYRPAQIVIDAKNHGVEVRPVCIKNSLWDSTIEYDENNQSILRLGFRLVKGLELEQAQEIIGTLQNWNIKSIEELWKKTTNLKLKSLSQLAHADAFKAWGYNRRNALWKIKALPKQALKFDYHWQVSQSSFSFIEQDKQKQLYHDYQYTGLSLRGHPIQFIRKNLSAINCPSVQSIKSKGEKILGKTILVAGLVLFRQKPGTSKGVVFLTLEDESGVANVVVMPPVFEKYQKAIIQSSALCVEGKLETNKEVLYLKAKKIFDISSQLG